jgi:conjugal transfer ATP-binding protein TraC
MLSEDENDKLPKLSKSLLEEAIVKTYEEHGCEIPTLSDFVKTLQASGETDLKNYAKMLYPWTGTRAYGRLLDGEGSLKLKSDFVVFDLKSLSSYPDLQSVMILIITDFILGKVESIKDRKKQILMDECWELLKSRSASQFMEYCARTLRKTGSSITFITQGLEEILQSPIGAAILNNTATKFILTQRGDLEPTRKILKMNDQEMALISSLRQAKGKYSEAFMIANEAKSVIRLIPTPIEYWLATSDASDNSLLENARQRFPQKSLPEILHYLAIHYPNGSKGISELKEEL